MIQIWYLSPFLIALLMWWVLTRKRPEDKEKWTWSALGVCSGAVLMFGLVFFSQPNGRNTRVDEAVHNALPSGPITLRSDSALEILAPARLRQHRSLVVGSLQLTLRDVTRRAVMIQIEPHDELAYPKAFGWYYKSGADSVLALQVNLGSHLTFAFRRRQYRLGLLETQLPLWGLASPELPVIPDAHAVIRILDIGPFQNCPPPGGTRLYIGTDPPFGGRAVDPGC